MSNARLIVESLKRETESSNLAQHLFPRSQPTGLETSKAGASATEHLLTLFLPVLSLGLLTEEKGVRLAQRHDALNLSALRERGESRKTLRQYWCLA